MKTLNIHLYNGDVTSLQVDSLDNDLLSNIFQGDKIPDAYIIHGTTTTLYVPSNQLMFVDYQTPELGDTPKDDSEDDSKDDNDENVLF